MKDIPEALEWTNSWSKAARSLALLEKWAVPRGILLVSRDHSKEQAIERLVKHLQPDRIIEVGPDKRRRQWDDELQVLKTEGVQENLFDTEIPERPCVVLRDMDDCSDTQLGCIKHLMENYGRPYNCLATAKNDESIPDRFSSYFYVWKKIGRPRKDETG